VGMTAVSYSPHDQLDPILTVQGLKTCGLLLAGKGEHAVPTTHPAVSPLFGNLEELPPTSVYSSTHDLLVLDARRLRDRFRAEGVRGVFRYREMVGLIHCYFLSPMPGTRETIVEIASFIRTDCSLQ
jgi:epsilon-lactone hydrolase